MSIFNDITDPVTMQHDQDKLILLKYRVSNSGHTLIPREKRDNDAPSRTFRDEKSIFASIKGFLSHVDYSKSYPVFINIIGKMNLPCLIYNRKRYYQVNRDVKRKIVLIMHNKTVES